MDTFDGLTIIKFRFSKIGYTFPLSPEEDYFSNSLKISRNFFLHFGKTIVKLFYNECLARKHLPLTTDMKKLAVFRKPREKTGVLERMVAGELH